MLLTFICLTYGVFIRDEGKQFMFYMQDYLQSQRLKMSFAETCILGACPASVYKWLADRELPLNCAIIYLVEN